MKIVRNFILTIISLFSIIYYTSVFYFNGKLILEKDGILLWTILMTVIIITLIIGLFNSREIMLNRKQMMILVEQNEKLIYLVENLSDKQDNDSDEIIETIRNSRSVSLDILNKIKRGDK